MKPFIYRFFKDVGVVAWALGIIMGRSSSCRGCTVQSSALFPHEVTSLWVIMRRTHYVYRVGLGTYYHVCTVKLFQSCCQLHLQDRLKNNKVFHTRLLLTLHWLLGRSYWQPVTHVSGGGGKQEESVQIIQGQKALGTNNCLIFSKPPLY